jgi:ribosomal protein S18 acetylase RimI-like enzyme
MPETTIIRDAENVDWSAVSALLARVGMASFAPEIHKRAFENSYTAVFLYDGETLVGLGRAISDGAYEAAVYDIAVAPEYQGRSLGRTIIETLLADLKGFNAILFAAPGKEPFYGRLGFRKMRTGMACFTSAEMAEAISDPVGM